ncbi:bifunctional 2-polyprenyl-6-hydroxyphenol methylase/3-demethylubiquinol 3-O-methyltransferase UbiG [Halorhodospira halochloris]|uniref:bifunctional 2-polyprenyl-6-hydroxyphenol methylase/3-demethylubiquinol 3-O-methyltransferase UbiG n=1 Tax=Halorhodospira halochloris TaxID=1052 RepID=UPI001EE7E7D8|nr:bifunctional 2-polyprenyl-6-hydroxyphenol methylase/3-demethylubiquinol 3-O-methyltransferase UbiG [Halorhodospira halochloris]MCG5530157.1 bifunctional 2-polyprenyl-6-hydroxyphenol methylase/3-demethylubiquinol 3-O-methyltransferase UbiG [Halorhodospira halochloris]MCG5548015.1 bifunctional 2-polyprenyl-6-hydroxyphenol methylase/3-demethylubiquinol 3-O-methyltransferase UbiG [Halorhodospira halochloris]
MAGHSDKGTCAANKSSRNEDNSATALFNATTDWWDPQGSLRTLHDINPTRVSWIAERIGGLRGKRILDVGAGGGILAAALARSGAQVMAIDTAAQALQSAKLHAEDEGLEGMEFRCCTVEELADEAERNNIEPFDAVVCMELLEHAPYPGSIIESCACLLRDGGDACFSTINRTHKAYAFVILGAEYLLGLIPRGTHQYNKLICPAELSHWARQSGLELIQLRGLGYNPITRNAWVNRDTTMNYLAHFRHKSQLQN